MQLRGEPFADEQLRGARRRPAARHEHEATREEAARFGPEDDRRGGRLDGFHDEQQRRGARHLRARRHPA